MSDYAVLDPTDVRKVQDKRYAYKYKGMALVRPATDAERAQNYAAARGWTVALTPPQRQKGKR